MPFIYDDACVQWHVHNVHTQWRTSLSEVHLKIVFTFIYSEFTGWNSTISIMVRKQKDNVENEAIHLSMTNKLIGFKENLWSHMESNILFLIETQFYLFFFRKLFSIDISFSYGDLNNKIWWDNNFSQSYKVIEIIDKFWTKYFK